MTNTHIPPPAILNQQQQHPGGGGQRGLDESGIYYSTPSEMPPQAVEKKQQRMLNKDGVFVSRETARISPDSVESNGDIGRPRMREGELQALC